MKIDLRKVEGGGTYVGELPSVKKIWGTIKSFLGDPGFLDRIKMDSRVDSIWMNVSIPVASWSRPMTALDSMLMSGWIKFSPVDSFSFQIRGSGGYIKN